MKEKDYFTINYPAVRTFTSDTGKINRDKHYIRSLIEVDVTNALTTLKLMRQPGRKISFLAWFIKVLADTVTQHPPINGIKSGRNKVVVFKDVNISVIVEKTVNGKPVPLPLVIRQANELTPLQITNIIQRAVEQEVKDASNLVLGAGENSLLMKLALIVPQWLRLFFTRVFVLENPQRVQEMMGTVVVTSLGTGGQITGWIIPTSMHPLSIGIGTLNKKPAIYKGSIEKRDILHLTIAFDHNVVDGMPARRFVEQLVSKLESASGLS